MKNLQRTILFKKKKSARISGWEISDERAYFIGTCPQITQITQIRKKKN